MLFSGGVTFNFMKVYQANKFIQSHFSSFGENLFYDRFIREWNVFFNYVRNRPLSLIEPKSHIPIYYKNIVLFCELFNIKPPKKEYFTNGCLDSEEKVGFGYYDKYYHALSYLKNKKVNDTNDKLDALRVFMNKGTIYYHGLLGFPLEFKFSGTRGTGKPLDIKDYDEKIDLYCKKFSELIKVLPNKNKIFQFVEYFGIEYIMNNDCIELYRIYNENSELPKEELEKVIFDYLWKTSPFKSN